LLSQQQAGSGNDELQMPWQNRRMNWRSLLLTTLLSLNPWGWASTGLTASAPISPAIDDTRFLQADELYNQGLIDYQAGDLVAAFRSWQQALTLYRSLKNAQGEALALGALSAVALSLGNYPEAIAHSQALLKLANSLSDQRRQMQALGNLGIAYKSLGSYNKAVATQQQALKLAQALVDRDSAGQILGNLGNAYEALGDYDTAKSVYEQGLAIARETRDRLGESILLSNLGGIHTNLAQAEPAKRLYEQSLQISQAIGDRSGQASTLINLGATYHAIGDPKQARNYYQQALAIASAAHDRRRESEALVSLGLAEADLGNEAQAIAYHQQSLAIARELKDPTAESVALNNLGHTLFNADKLAAAEATLEQAIKILDSLRSGLSDRYSVSLFDTQLYTYNLLQQIRVAANKPEAALEAAEQGRARAFADLLTRQLAADEKTNETDEKAVMQRGTDELFPLSVAHSSASSVPQSVAESVASVAQIRQIAREQNATLVEYTIVPDDEFMFRGKLRAPAAELLIWVVQPSGQIHLRRVDLQSQPPAPTQPDAPIVSRSDQDIRGLAELVTSTRTAIRGLGVVSSQAGERTDTTPLAFNPEPDRMMRQLRQLHQILIAPIADLLPTDPNDRVVFIPQESLFLVPFAALKAPDDHYLIEKHTILTAPAIHVLDLTRQQRLRLNASAANAAALIVGNPTMPKVALAVGDPPTQLPPLPGSEQEAIAIARLLQSPAVLGTQATETLVKQQLQTAQRVHLATHGLLEYVSLTGQAAQTTLDVPGAIALAPSSTDDGLLTASEILNLRLQAELVVLSACDTGQGRITGDGVIGLSRALVAAGVPSVVVSLWAVPDTPTATLMTAFYEQLQRQPDKASALRQAMLATMHSYPNPMNWAAFTLIGES
jgi:CHAT domain-containing protein